MEEATATMATAVLENLGFTNQQGEAPWNMVQMEREFPNASITVWGRDWSPLFVQLKGGSDESVVTLAEVSDEQALVQVIEKAAQFLEFVSQVAPLPKDDDEG